jgi:hypothetical protein
MAHAERDWSTDPRFGSDDRPVGSLAELEALCARRLAEIIGPEGPAFEAQVFRYHRELSRYGAITGEYDNVPWGNDAAGGSLLDAAYEAVLGVGLFDDEGGDGRFLDYVLPVEREGQDAAQAHPWELRDPAVGLGSLLAEGQDAEPEWRITDLWPAGGNVVLAAPAKAGKSTLVGNLLRSLADGVPLFGPPVAGIIGDQAHHGAYTVTPLEPGETIYLADVELTRGMLRRWLGDQRITNVDRINVELFRGRVDELDVTDPTTSARLVARLRAERTRIVIVDPVGPLMTALGLNESSNRDVNRFLTALTAMCAAAGVAELLVVHHMGHDAERSRGASEWRGWPDVEWRLIRPKGRDGREPAPDAPRFFTASGRDVELPETALLFDRDQRRLSLAAGDRTAFVGDRNVEKVLAVIESAPGLGRNALEAKVQEVGLSQAAARSAIKAAVVRGEAHTHPGPNRTLLHHPGEACDACSAAEGAA